MAADQRKKKRVNAASLVGCTSSEKYRVNRRKLHVQQHDLNMRPYISLEWDSRKRSVVSRKEQIGLLKRHLIPFVEPAPRGHNILADVVSVPPQIFELDNLSEVLSYEVWQSHLSDNERNFLSQFLPKEVEPDKLVRDLLSGDNVHFGNPSMKWSVSLCVGELHPDNVLHEEQSLKDAKKAYYSFIQNYHNNMIKNLQTWKEKWLSCMDPELDIMQNIWSSRKRGERTVPTSDARFCGTEENHVATPDSCSWENSEMAYSSENQYLGTVQGESLRRRDMLKISDSSTSGLKVVAVAHRKGDKLHQWNVHQNDGAKYMSYIKVSKEQHERVKSSIKYAGNSIQPRSLNNVLGNFDALNVQPFAIFEEEERKKLHEHWVKLASKDILEGYANWRNRQLQRQELTQSLCEEIWHKVELQKNILDEEKDISSNVTELLGGDGELPLTDKVEDPKEIGSDYRYEKRTSDSTKMDEDEDEDEDGDGDEDEDENAPNHIFIQDQNDLQVSSHNNSPRSMMINSSSPGFVQDQHHHQQQISSLDSNPHTNSMEMESHCESGSAKDEDPHILSGYSGNMNHVDIPLSQEAPLPSSSEVWPVSDVNGSYYQSTTSNSQYASTHELSVGHPQLMQGQAVQMLEIQTSQSEKDCRKDMLHRQSEDTLPMPFFSSYSNQDRSELLHSLLKGQSNLSYHQPEKHPGLDFQPGNDLVMETGHFSGHFREHVHPPVSMGLRQKILNDPYLHPNIQENIYSGSRFDVPRQEELPVNINIHDWGNVNGVRVPVPCQSHLSNGELGPSWYAAAASENGSRDGWHHSFEPPVGVSHGFNSGGNSDQTLFSVISECRELPRASYNGERLIQSTGSYNGIGIPSSGSLLAQAPPNPLNYLSGHESSGGIKMNNIGWMGLPQQNTGIQESISKPFLRSWNQ